MGKEKPPGVTPGAVRLKASVLCAELSFKVGGRGFLPAGSALETVLASVICSNGYMCTSPAAACTTFISLYDLKEEVEILWIHFIDEVCELFVKKHIALV
jgi:hypothetical protein